MEPEGFTEDDMYIVGCLVIMMIHYKFSLGASRPMVMEIPNIETGDVRHYRSAFNADFMEVIPTDKAPKLTEKDFVELMDNYTDIDLWKKKIPPNSYVLRGIGIMNMQDITVDQSMNMLNTFHEEGQFAKVVEVLTSQGEEKNLKDKSEEERQAALQRLYMLVDAQWNLDDFSGCLDACARALSLVTITAPSEEIGNLLKTVEVSLRLFNLILQCLTFISNIYRFA